MVASVSTLVVNAASQDANVLVIVRVPLAELRHFRHQAAGKVTKGRVEKIAQSMKKHGQLVPIVVTTDGEIIAGHNRMEAAKSLGWTHINAIVSNAKPEEVFVWEHAWAPTSANYAEATEQGLSVELIDSRQPKTAHDIQECIRIFGGIGPVNDRHWAPGDAQKTVMRISQNLIARLDPRDVPSVQDIGSWMVEHRMLRACKSLLSARAFPAKRLQSAIVRNKPFRA